MRALGALYAGLYLLVTITAPVSVIAETVDPVYEWTQYALTIAGSGTSRGQIVAASDGSVYDVGFFDGTVNFNPKGAGDIQSSNSGSIDVYVTKWNADGSYGWTRVIGGPGTDLVGAYPEEFAYVDSNDAIIFSGSYRDTTNFNPLGSDIRTHNSHGDNFVTKWNADGSYGWTHVFGSPVSTPIGSDENIQWVTVDSSDNVYVAGEYANNTDFDPYGGGDVRTTVDSGGRDASITRINSNGSYGWTVTFGSDAGDYFRGNNQLVESGDGSGFYAALRFEGTDIDVDPGAGVQTVTHFNPASGRPMNVVLKLSYTGDLIWHRTLEEGDTGPSLEYNRSDSSGAFYTIGFWSGTRDFDPTAGVDTDSKAPGIGTVATYVMKLESNGDYAWSRRQEAPVFSSRFFVRSFQVTDEGIYAAYALWATADWEVNRPAGSEMVTPDGDEDTVIVKWSPSGELEWTRKIAGSSYDFTYEIGVDQVCNSVYVLNESYGNTGGTNIALDQFGSDTRSAPDTGAMIMTRMSSFGNYSWSNFVDTADDFFYTTRTAAAPGDSVYYAGWVQGSAVNFNSFGSDVLDTSGDIVSFITKLSNTNYRQHVINLATSVEAEEIATGDNARLGNIGVARTSSTTIRVPDADNAQAIADIGADLRCDRDWSGVDGESDAPGGRSFITELTNAEGTASILDLYVPVTGNIGVGVCPGATSLAQLNNACIGYYELLDGDAGLTKTTINSQEYWHVLGISDSGGFNLTTLNTTETDTPELVDTGSKTIISIAIGLVISVSVIVILRVSRSHYYHYLAGRR